MCNPSEMIRSSFSSFLDFAKLGSMRARRHRSGPLLCTMIAYDYQQSSQLYGRNVDSVRREVEHSSARTHLVLDLSPQETRVVCHYVRLILHLLELLLHVDRPRQGCYQVAYAGEPSFPPIQTQFPRAPTSPRITHKLPERPFFPNLLYPYIPLIAPPTPS
jgi:hypothetical protein